MKAVVLLGHGSKVRDAEKDMELVADALRKALHGTVIETSYLSLTPPPFEDAVSACVRAGAESITVIPYMLSQGAHVLRDIPEMVSRESEKHPGVKIVCGDYLSFDYDIVDCIRRRIAAAQIPEPPPRPGELMAGQKLAVLSTSDVETRCPYTSLVGFVPMDGMKRIVFATLRDSRKFRNLAANPRVSLLIDNRHHGGDVFFSAEAATVIGAAREVPSGMKEAAMSLFLAAHPRLEDFVRNPDCALVCVEVEKILHVSGFQNVTEAEVK